ncbi:hypothetical protein M427DRAFT_51353 [Gonapodya prolifera JEL478]|uniref:Uncharacterized protein n=1 Tax=Gonapodya prolifera (strain JEL478) TaxID=1344416 RepID=A0A139AX73_GONPJ|nr:hypothetical protein M427DRAFT_51353 [Gonapodya prolifera JEL478]|eukprot:KXS21065.1 hypothetical protein M427DRAFT_51353 [Gonapodya prolifera JEL478]
MPFPTALNAEVDLLRHHGLQAVMQDIDRDATAALASSVDAHSYEPYVKDLPGKHVPPLKLEGPMAVFSLTDLLMRDNINVTQIRPLDPAVLRNAVCELRPGALLGVDSSYLGHRPSLQITAKSGGTATLPSQLTGALPHTPPTSTAPSVAAPVQAQAAPPPASRQAHTQSSTTFTFPKLHISHNSANSSPFTAGTSPAQQKPPTSQSTQTAPTHPSQPSQLVQPLRPTQPPQPQPIRPTQTPPPAQPIRPTQPSQTSQSIRPTQPSQTVQPTVPPPPSGSQLKIKLKMSFASNPAVQQSSPAPLDDHAKAKRKGEPDGSIKPTEEVKNKKKKK